MFGPNRKSSSFANALMVGGIFAIAMAIATYETRCTVVGEVERLREDGDHRFSVRTGELAKLLSNDQKILEKIDAASLHPATQK